MSIIGVSIVGIFLVMIGSGILMGVCQLSYSSVPTVRNNSRDISTARNYWTVIVLNVVAIFGTYIGAVLLFTDYLIRSGPTYWYDVVLAILLYDFGYYWLHRVMHTKFLMRHLHGWHHRCKHPTAIDGLYQRPHETVLALSMLMVCVALVGPVSVPSFVLVIFIHTLINMLDHANLRTGVGWLDHIMHAHDLHHSSRNVNFGFTPLWDYVFGTTHKDLKHAELENS